MYDLDNIEQLQREINTISRQTGLGELSIANALMMYGHNHRGIGNPVTTNLDNAGMIFFTRPNLNLSEANIISKRVLAVLSTSTEYSIPRMVRAYLDPRSNWCYDIPVGAKRPNIQISSPLVNSLTPFIPILSNNLISLSGWPDIDMDSYTSEEGISRQTYSHIDSIGEILNSFTLTANFRNVAGDPITLMFLVWLLYSGYVYRGDLMPWPESIVENEIDYCTRIYRLVLDPARRYVQKIAAIGYGYPTAISIGASMNFSAEKPMMDETAQITVPFRCTGAQYNDPITINEFNRIGFKFCPMLRDSIHGLSGQYFKLSPDLVRAFNYRGLPHINEDTMELEWWVTPAEYNQYMSDQGAQNG